MEEAAASNYGEANVTNLGDHYSISEVINADQLCTEWQDLRVHLILHCSSLCMKEVLSLLAKEGTAIASIYPNFSKLSQIFLCLPISTADCERAFSTMKRIKTRLRTQMTNTTLNHCMRISIEGLPLPKFDFEQSINTWSRLKNRRISV